MDGMEFVVALTAIGCGTAIIITFIDKAFGVFGTTKHKSRLESAQQQLRLAEERGRHQELRIVELSRQNEQLQKQLEWHGKLLETQDQMLKRLGSGDPASVR
jgi:hypothetical protein